MTNDLPSTTTSAIPSPADRLVSLDALRGFDMFWIVGADAIVAGVRKLSDHQVAQFAARHLEHVEWEGLVFYDLIFPLFVFLMGVAIPFSLGPRLARGDGMAGVYLRLLRRFVVLYLLGVLYYGGLSNDWPGEVRLVGVLQRIAVAYLAGAVLFLNFRTRWLLVWTAALLVGYWALMSFVTIGEFGGGDYTPAHNLCAYVDREFLPGRAWFKELGWDPEGLLSTLPAIATGLIGVVAGQLMASAKRPGSKLAWLAIAGIALVAAGYAWGLWLPAPWRMPIIKNLWTSSFVLATAGYSCLLMALFYLLIDVWKLRRWAHPFVVIGSNAIVIYMAVELVPFDQLADRLVGGDVADALGRFAGIVRAAVQLGLAYALVAWLYRRRIFVRV